MAAITITGKKKLKTISEEIQEQFPYLFVVFLGEEAQKQTEEKGGKVKALSFEHTLAAVRTVTPKVTTDISIHGLTKVSTLENNFRKEYGLNLQISYANEKGAYYTKGKLDDMTLTQLNTYLEENGYKKNHKLYKK